MKIIRRSKLLIGLRIRLSDNDEIEDDYRINVNDEEVTITAKYADDHLDVDIDIKRK